MERRFYSEASDPVMHEAAIVTSMTVRPHRAHDYVALWNRGVLAGELVLRAGDGELLARALGLVESMQG